MFRKITVTVAIFALLISVPAFAYDWKIYPGAMGSKIYSTDPDPNKYFLGAISNPSTSQYLYVKLPVIRDHAPYAIFNAWVRAVDFHPQANICGNLWSIYQINCNMYGWVSPQRCTSGNSCSVQQLNFPGVGGNWISHAYFLFRIPPRYKNSESRINAYLVNEV